MPLSPEERDLLITELASFSDDPLGFVLWNYPWGEPGELEDYEGPELWQRLLLQSIGDGVISIRAAIAESARHEEVAETHAIREATTSGHGIGKSALVSWIIDWAQSTMEDSKGVVTANTETQLKTKTWAELAKWHRLGMTKHLFKLTATARFSIDPEHEKTWRVDMVPWSEKNVEAFAGLHNKGKRIILIFDEASNIPELIWETAEGALTDKDTEIIWCVYGNPTKSSGRFRDCFPGGKFEHRWNSRAVDSRTVSITNKAQMQEWVTDYGEDHDFVRVRVRGMFPRVDATSFISYEDAMDATRRVLPEHNNSAVVIGVDTARFGPDSTVIYPRQGRDGRSRQPVVLKSATSIQIATAVFDLYSRYNATAVFVDIGGQNGGGTVDQLALMGVPVFAVDFGSKADNYGMFSPRGTQYLNKRAEIWGEMRGWLMTGCIPEHVPGMEITLPDELAAPTYSFAKDVILQLESKRDMRRRSVASPDISDALACTFAFPMLEPLPGGQQPPSSYKDYNPYDHLEKEYA